MKKKILPLLLFFVASHATHGVNAQPPVVIDTEATKPLDTEKIEGTESSDTEETEPFDTYKPPVENYPSFNIELLRVDCLFNLDPKTGRPLPVKKFDWGSLFRGNGAFLYAMRLNQSRFAFCLGIGFSTLQYAFSGKDSGDETIYKTLKKEGKNLAECQDIDSVAQLGEGAKVSGSTFKVPYFDCLFRIRFNSVLDEPKQGFHVWLGAKLGVRRLADTTIYYSEYDDSGASLVRKGHFNLDRFTFGLQGGVGYRRFGLTGGCHLMPLFVKNQGPKHSDSIRPFSLGIYVDLL